MSRSHYLTAEHPQHGSTVLALDAQGQADYPPEYGGLITLIAEASDVAGNRSRQELVLEVTDPGDLDAPQLQIHNPTHAQEIITISVTDDNLKDWTLS